MKIQTRQTKQTKQKQQKPQQSKNIISKSNPADWILEEDYIIAIPIAAVSTSEGIIEADAYEDKDTWGVVVNCGKGRTLDNGTRLEMEIKKGDHICFGGYVTEKFRHGGVDYLWMRADDVKCRI